MKEGKANPVHAIQYKLISKAPYKYTQANILFLVCAERNGIPNNDAKIRAAFFEKSRPNLWNPFQLLLFFILDIYNHRFKV